MGQKVEKVHGRGPNRVRMLLARGSLDISGDLEGQDGRQRGTGARGGGPNAA